MNLTHIFITSFFQPDNLGVEVLRSECERAYRYGRELVPIKILEEHFIQLNLEVRKRMSGTVERSHTNSSQDDNRHS